MSEARSYPSLFLSRVENLQETSHHSPTSAGTVFPWIVTHRVPIPFLGIDTLGNTPEVKCYNGISVRLRIRSHPSVYPGDSYTLTLSRRHSGDVKKYQQAFLVPLPGNGFRESMNPTILVSFIFLFISTSTPAILGRLSLYTPSAHYE